MHPSILEDLGLTVALESLTQDLELASGVPARFEAIGVPEKVPAPIASCLYRVCQECVRNIVNHADARDIRIRLSGQGDWLELEVTDSGKGFDPKTVKRGLGTFSMMERVSLVGGTISVYSQPNQGTRVTVRVPLGPDLQQ
jgi:signal transduction histidine kinase